MQSVLIIRCFICKVSLLFSALYAKCPYYLQRDVDPRSQYMRANYLSWSKTAQDYTWNTWQAGYGGHVPSAVERIRHFCCGAHAHLNRPVCQKATDTYESFVGENWHTVPSTVSGIPLVEIYTLIGRNDQYVAAGLGPSSPDFRAKLKEAYRALVREVRATCDLNHTNLLLVPPAELIPSLMTDANRGYHGFPSASSPSKFEEYKTRRAHVTSCFIFFRCQSSRCRTNDLVTCRVMPASMYYLVLYMQSVLIF